MNKWFCNECGAQFDNPAEDGRMIRGKWFPRIDGTVTHICPYCFSRKIEELDECPTCNGGWKRKGEKVCPKCHLRNVGEIRLFVHRFSPATLSDMDDILEGNGLEMFA